MDQTSFDYNFNLRFEVVEALFCYCLTCFNIYKGHSLFLTKKYGSESWCLTPLSTMYQLYRGSRSDLLMEEAGIPGENHGQNH